MKFSKRGTAALLAAIIGCGAVTACTEEDVAAIEGFMDLSGTTQEAVQPSAPVEAPAPEPEQTDQIAPDSAPVATEALRKLDEIWVKGRAPKTGYDRDNFGSAWADVDRNGCDTRNDILQRDLTDIVFKDGTKQCVVASGVLQDDYTGTTIDFVRGQGTSIAVQIDHVVPLSDAWQKGAQQWTDEKRLQFANDPINLVAVDGPTNGSKSDSDLATWLPPNRDYWCEYATNIVEVKHTYEVWMTQAEHDKAREILSSC